MNFTKLFRIFYSTFFTILNIILLGLLLITPADAINQALKNKQIYNVFVIGGAYLLTFALATIIYASRLFTNRSVLAGIPKTWIPIEKGDVTKSVRKMIVESLSRSAIIAWDARPRVSTHLQATLTVNEMEERKDQAGEPKQKRRIYHRLLWRNQVPTQKDEGPLTIPPHPPVWGNISHEGWSSPSSIDLPNLQYVTVIQELPHLVEAKAVSLAPVDPDSNNSPPTPDLRAIDLLQRPAAMCLRDYMSHLTSLGVLSPKAPVVTFLTTYENARFSPRPLSEPDFRELMKLFADILRDMTALSPDIIQSIEQEESDIDGDMSSTTTPETPRSRSPVSSVRSVSRSGSEGTVRTVPSRKVANERSLTHLSAAGIAPVTPSRKERFVERSPSVQSFSQTRRPYAASQSSSGSLRSQSSVIRLNKGQSPDDLPYTLQVPSSSA